MEGRTCQRRTGFSYLRRNFPYYVCSRQTYPDALHFRRSFRNTAGSGHSLEISFYYGSLPLHFVFSLCLPLCPAGTGKYNDSYAQRCDRILYSYWCGAFPASCNGNKWDFLCGNRRMDRGGSPSGSQLLRFYAKILA